MFDRREEVNLSCSVLLPTLNRGSLKKSASQAKTTREPSKSFVKQLEERLLIQKQEIDRNEMVVKKLTMQFEQVKEQYIREQDRSHIL
jgi:ABC-type sulfate/molybdate transport systems ATPase subunit